MAAQSSVAKSFIYAKEAFESIVTVTLNILEACKDLDYQGRIIFAGRSEWFGEHKYGVKITSNKRPNNPYGIAKLSSYNLVRMYREINQLNCVTGVLFNHQSQLRDQSFVTQKIIEAVIKCEHDRKYKINLGNLNIFRDWGWAEEYMEAVYLITNRDKIVKDHIICTGKPTRLTTIMDKAFRFFDLNWQDHIVISKKNLRAADIECSFGNPDFLSSDLNWKSKCKIEDIIRMLINDQKNINQYKNTNI